MVSGLVGAWNSHISHISSWIGGPVNQIPSSVAWQTKSPPRIQLKSQSLSSDMVKPPKPPWFLPFLHRDFHLLIAGSGTKFSTAAATGWSVAGIASASVDAPSGPARWREKQPWRCQQKLPQARSAGGPSFLQGMIPIRGENDHRNSWFSNSKRWFSPQGNHYTYDHL